MNPPQEQTVGDQYQIRLVEKHYSNNRYQGRTYSFTRNNGKTFETKFVGANSGLLETLALHK